LNIAPRKPYTACFESPTITTRHVSPLGVEVEVVVVEVVVEVVVVEVVVV